MKADLLACLLSCLPEVGMWGPVSLCSGVSSKRYCMHALKKEVRQGVQEAESLNQRGFCKDSWFSREIVRFPAFGSRIPGCLTRCSVALKALPFAGGTNAI